MYSQLVAPVYASGRQYWCLEHTQKVFGAPAMYANARAAWDGQKGRHAGEPPLGIAVPMWSDYWADLGDGVKNYGHVWARLADGSVLSSPIGKLTGYSVFSSYQEMLAVLGGNPKLLGWSEYMHTVKVVEKVNVDEGEEVYYVQASVQGSKWAVSVATGRKRLISRAEWSRIRAAEGRGMPVPLITITQKEIDSIPG